MAGREVKARFVPNRSCFMVWPATVASERPSEPRPRGVHPKDAAAEKEGAAYRWCFGSLSSKKTRLASFLKNFAVLMIRILELRANRESARLLRKAGYEQVIEKHNHGAVEHIRSTCTFQTQEFTRPKWS